MRPFFSNTVTAWPARASCCAAARPAGPEPTTATVLPVFCAAGCGFTQPSAQARSMMACSMRLDADRVVVDVERAGCLARRRADAAGELGEVVGRVQHLDGVVPVAAEHQVVEVRNDVVDRAAAVAERRAAVHAARALHLGLLVVERDDELLPVLHPLGHGLVASSTRSYSRKPVTFPMVVNPCFRSCRRYLAAATVAALPRALPSGGLGLAFGAELGQRALVLVREDLDELAARLGPVVEDVARAQAAGPAVVVLDQLLQHRLVGLAACANCCGRSRLPVATAAAPCPSPPWRCCSGCANSPSSS